MPGDEEKDDLRTLGPFSILHYSNSDRYISIDCEWIYQSDPVYVLLRLFNNITIPMKDSVL